MSRRNGKTRRQFTPDEKATILRRHLADKVPVSDLCDEYRIQPSIVYFWKRQALENLGAAFQDGRSRRGQEQTAKYERERITGLEAKLATKDAVIAEVSEEYLPLKKSLGRAEGAMGAARSPRRGRRLRPHVHHPHRAPHRMGPPAPRRRAGAVLSLGAALRHAARAAGPDPARPWLAAWERQAILDFHDRHPLEGYRRLTFMMLDADVVAVSPASVYRVLKAAGRLDRWQRRPSRQGTGFIQPLTPHEHWHTDITYVNLAGTFQYLCGVLDGCSRYMLHWELREQMTEADVEIIVQRAHEQFPDARPRLISDHGPQFIARDFHEFIRQMGMTHVRTAPYYPQSNGKYERWNGTLKATAIRPKAPDSPEAAQRVVREFVEYYKPFAQRVRRHHARGHAGGSGRGDLGGPRSEAGSSARAAASGTERSAARPTTRPQPSAFNHRHRVTFPLNQDTGAQVPAVRNDPGALEHDMV